jgi:DNA-binding NarL/FixJ family response regulator
MDGNAVLASPHDASGSARPDRVSVEQTPTLTRVGVFVYSPTGLQALSRRQCEVLEHVASGWMERETATALGISTGMVRAHMTKVRVALGARNTIHAVALAIALGILALRQDGTQ